MNQKNICQNIALDVCNISKCYTLSDQTKFNRLLNFSSLFGQKTQKSKKTQNTKNEKSVEFWALRDISMRVKHGERVGIIGRNGAGKSTLLKILSRVIMPTKGKALIYGKLTPLLELGTGFSDNLTGQENIFLNAKFYGLTTDEINQRYDGIVEFADIGKFIDAPLKHYSSGMRARLAFAVAAHLDPDILIMDEVLAVGDMAFQEKCLKRVRGMAENDHTILFVSHSMDAIAQFCTRCIWLDAGRIIMDGSVDEVTAAYARSMMKLVSSIEPKALSKNTNAIEQETSSQNDMMPASLGDEPAAEVISAKVIDSNGDETIAIRLNECVGIELEFKILKQGIFVPSIGLLNSDKKVIFWSVPPEMEVIAHKKEVGFWRSIVWIPPNILNVGIYYVTLAINSPDINPMKRHVLMESALSFQMVESASDVKSSRGIMPRKFPGPIRPILDWESYGPDVDTNS